MRRILVTAVLILLGVRHAGAEDIRIGTYNVENFYRNFQGHQLQIAATTRPAIADAEAIRERRALDDRNNWAVAQTILDAQFRPDILCVIECCDEEDLKFFNRRWLDSAYDTVLVFKTNTDRGQNLGMILKKGYRVLEKKEYFNEPDPAAPAGASQPLFARGPAFALVQSAGGHKFWLGLTHQKSKSGNDLRATRWRNRESQRTHEIIRELRQRGPAEVIFVGDMNDDLGMDELEKEAGADAVALLAGKPEDGLVLLTDKLAREGAISYHGYWKTRYRSLIDHIVITREAAGHVKKVAVFTGSLSLIASDHFPVYVDLSVP